jgi:16S rRNA (guanine966-N2)-methyltransferase
MNRRPLGRLRIIGGQWRSRLVDFDAGEGVRPTPDRVRQTLFDWLSPLIEGARCLDLFAGSGALGLEALSRGAAQSIFVEQGAAQAAAIRAAADKLASGPSAQVVQAEALNWLRAATGPFDVVFLDPPYDSELLAPALAGLPRILAPQHRVYLEWPQGQPLALPSGFRLLKEKAAGQVSYGLAAFTAAASEGVAT